MIRQKKRRVDYRPHPNPVKAKQGVKVRAEILDFKTIKEAWNVYELEDGTRVRLRVSAAKFVKPFDIETDELVYSREGEPIYGLDIVVQTTFEYPEELTRPQTRR